MQLLNLSADTLRSVIKLLDQRDALTEEINRIEKTINDFIEGGSSRAPKTGAKRGRKPLSVKAAVAKASVAAKVPAAKSIARKGKRGALKSKILKSLEAAGSEGVTVKELSDKLGVKSQNLHVWFSSTGKSIPEITKIGEGRYSLKA
jgi:hypothetical protein